METKEYDEMTKEELIDKLIFYKKWVNDEMTKVHNLEENLSLIKKVVSLL